MAASDMVYEWRGRSFKIDPNLAAAEIAKIAASSPSGAALSADIVEASRPKRAVLHDVIFDLDDRAAAEEHRKQIARHLTNSLYVVTTNGETTSTPAFYHVNYETTEGERVEGYQPVEQVIQNVTARGSAADVLLRELEGLQRRFDDLAEFQIVWKAVQKARQALERKAA